MFTPREDPTAVDHKEQKARACPDNLDRAGSSKPDSDRRDGDRSAADVVTFVVAGAYRSGFAEFVDRTLNGSAVPLADGVERHVPATDAATRRPAAT